MVIQEHPQNAEVQYRLGLSLIELGQYTPARKALQKALKLDPKHTGAAQTLNQLRRFQR